MDKECLKNLRSRMHFINYLRYMLKIKKYNVECLIARTIDEIENNSVIPNGTLKFKIVRSKYAFGLASKNTVTISSGLLKQIETNENSLRRVIAHEIAHIEFGEYKFNPKNNTKVNSSNQVSNKEIRRIFIESRADFRSKVLSKLNCIEYSESFEIEKKEEKEGSLKKGYLPIEERMTLIDNQIRTLIELETKVEKVLENNYGVFCSNDLMSLIKEDRMSAASKFNEGYSLKPSSIEIKN